MKRNSRPIIFSALSILNDVSKYENLLDELAVDVQSKCEVLKTDAAKEINDYAALKSYEFPHKSE